MGAARIDVSQVAEALVLEDLPFAEVLPKAYASEHSPLAFGRSLQELVLQVNMALLNDMYIGHAKSCGSRRRHLSNSLLPFQKGFFVGICFVVLQAPCHLFQCEVEVRFFLT